MDTGVLVTIVLVVLVVLIAVAVVVTTRRRRSEKLQEQYGPEYERTVEESGGRRQAESDLSERSKRAEGLDIRPLTAESRESYSESWRQTQSEFVDSPEEAVGKADELVQEVMRERGYPVENFEQAAADVSVEHPRVVGEYRAAHAISMAQQHGEASTEDLRQAMVHYRALFEELLND